MKVICAKCRKEVQSTAYSWVNLTPMERAKYILSGQGDSLLAVTCPKHGRVNVVLTYKENLKINKHKPTLLVHTKDNYHYFPPLSWLPEPK